MLHSPRCTWKLELGVQVQVTVSSLQSHSSRLQRSSRPLYTLARAATTTTSTNTAASRDMALRQPHHRTITIMALTSPGACCCCVVCDHSVVDNAQYFSLFTLVAAAVAAALSAGCGLGAPRPAS